MKDIASIINEGGIGVIPTDTVLGIVGSAFSKEAVEKIYDVRIRDKDKPLIVLIENIDELEKFGVKNVPKDELKKIWPGKVSVILEIESKNLEYLDRGTKSLCFRVPKDKFLNELLKKTGPLVAPSANIQGEPVANNIEEAKKYFGDRVDFFVDGSSKEPTASTILMYLTYSKTFELVREGAVSIDRLKQKNLLK